MGACYGGKEEKGQNHGGSMMQKAIELKKKKNLEPIKGNKRSSLVRNQKKMFT
jgi:hypothetical protein